MEYEKRNEIKQSLLDYSKSKVGESNLANVYAYSFGMLFAMLSDSQLKNLDKMVKGGSK